MWTKRGCVNSAWKRKIFLFPSSNHRRRKHPWGGYCATPNILTPRKPPGDSRLPLYKTVAVRSEQSPEVGSVGAHSQGRGTGPNPLTTNREKSAELTTSMSTGRGVFRRFMRGTMAMRRGVSGIKPLRIGVRRVQSMNAVNTGRF